MARAVEDIHNRPLIPHHGTGLVHTGACRLHGISVAGDSGGTGPGQVKVYNATSATGGYVQVSTNQNRTDNAIIPPQGLYFDTGLFIGAAGDYDRFTVMYQVE